jgi:hypothetical protein
VSRRYVVWPKADQDLDDQAYCYGTEVGPELGHRFLVAAHDTFALLAMQPEMVGVPGLVIGFLLAFVLGRLMTAALVGVAPLDTVTYGFTMAALAGVGLVATLLPAMRASSVEPSTVLRNAWHLQ